MLCFRKILVAKKFTDKREGEVSRFHSKFKCLTVPKSFVRETFCDVFQKISCSEKVFWTSRVEYEDFPSKTFCLRVPKNFVGVPFIVSFFSGIEKLYASEVYVTIFRRSFFVSQYRKIS